MTTPVDIIKEILYTNATASDYNNYSIKPNLIIFGRDDLGTIPPGGVGSIVIKDVSDDRVVATNGKHLFSKGVVECVIAETKTDLRDTFFNDIKTLLESSSYRPIIKNIRRDDRRNLYINIFEIHLLN
ncbi:MAG: hypothetical protein ACFFG0_05635 [Candidatus Thorarchaeota archaeon]